MPCRVVSRRTALQTEIYLCLRRHGALIYSMLRDAHDYAPRSAALDSAGVAAQHKARLPNKTPGAGVCRSVVL